MPAKVRSLLIFLVLLIPSLRFVLAHKSMPEFGYLHDDGIQYVGAKSLAQGTGYRLLSLPESPPQTKYPPLLPLYLSIAWRLDPNFPANLRIASWACWIILVLFLALSWCLFRGCPPWKLYLIAGLLAFNPYVILFGVTPFSEVLFSCLLIGTLLLAERPEPKWGIAAGLLASAAYLTRTAGIALLLTLPAWWLWKRQRRHALFFVLAMLPGVLAWSLWSRSVMASGGDTTVIYYVDYLRYQFLNVGPDNLAVVIWKNLDQTLYSIGALILPKVIDLPLIKILTEVLAAASISGIVRLVRRGEMVPYALFSAVSLVILILWHFPPTERFVLPLFPLIAAGFVEELSHLFSNLRTGFRHKDTSQRVAAVLFGSVVGVLLAITLATQMFVTFSYLDQSADQKQAKLDDLKQAYTWISANLPPSAKILSYDDPLMYLYTGHQGNYLPLLPRLWYAEDHDKMVDAYRNLAAYCRSRGLDYVYFTTDDPGREVGDEDRQRIAEAVKNSSELVPLFHAGIGTVYKVK
jgi:hypothetical protein